MAAIPSLWSTGRIAGYDFELLNLDHSEVARRVLDDIEAGITVYYDQRWAATERLCRFLLEEPAWLVGRQVLVLGAGVGLETVVIGKLCAKLYVNDLSPGALELCARQLRRNGVQGFVCLPGRYETLPLPAVDLIVGCFLVYNRDTRSAMQHLLRRCTPPVLLLNDNFSAFRTLVRHAPRSVHSLLPRGDFPCLLFDRADEAGTDDPRWASWGAHPEATE
jgi:hypothetical protein